MSYKIPTKEKGKGIERVKTKMESTHVLAITNEEENIARSKENKTFQFHLPPIISHLGKNEVHCVSITSNPRHKQMQSGGHDMRKIIHCIKVGISLVLVSLLYLLNPLFKQVGENAMWAIMTVVVMFEFSAGTYFQQNSIQLTLIKKINMIYILI